MVSSNSIERLENTLLRGYLGFLRFAGVAFLTFAVMNLITLICLFLFGPEPVVQPDWLKKQQYLASVSGGGLLVLVGSIIIGPLYHYSMSILIHPSRLGPIVTHLGGTPDSEAYTESLMAFVTIHILQPLIGLFLMIVNIFALYFFFAY